MSRLRQLGGLPKRETPLEIETFSIDEERFRHRFLSLSLSRQLSDRTARPAYTPRHRTLSSTCVDSGRLAESEGGEGSFEKSRPASCDFRRASSVLQLAFFFGSSDTYKIARAQQLSIARISFLRPRPRPRFVSKDRNSTFLMIATHAPNKEERNTTVDPRDSVTSTRETKREDAPSRRQRGSRAVREHPHESALAVQRQFILVMTTVKRSMSRGAL